jgi:hypothetical protein
MNAAQEQALALLNASRESFIKEFSNRWIALNASGTVRFAERFDLLALYSRASPASTASDAYSPTTLDGVGGSVRAALMQGITLEFQSLRIATDVMFDYSNSVRPLFDRSGMRVLQDVGMDHKDWHWNP